MTYFKKAAV